MRAEPALEAAEVFELRVLEGEQRGARAEIPLARSFEIGGIGTPCEVQLRDPLIGMARVRVVLRGAAGARVEVLDGEVLLNGASLGLGAHADWPLYTPLQIGTTVLAIGEPDSAQWQLPMLAAEPAPAPAEVAAPDAQLMARLDDDDDPQDEAPPRRRLESWLSIGGSVLAVAAVALLVFSTLLSPHAPPRVDLQQRMAQLLLTQPEFQPLRVEAGSNGVPVVRGYLDSSERVQRLRRVLADGGLGEVRVEVWSGEQLTAAVTDVFRVQGITAEARADAVGQVTVRTQESDAGRLARAAAVARRDVAGLAGLVLQNQPPAPLPDNTPVADDPGKRVASIVPGESPYVVTADGTRYFVGGLLPTGHRIEAIDAHRVQLAKDGQRSELAF